MRGICYQPERQGFVRKLTERMKKLGDTREEFNPNGLKVFEVCFKNLLTGTAGEQVAMRMRCKLYSGSCLRGSPPLPSPLASISGYVQVEGEGAVWSSWRPLLVTLAMSGALIMVVEKVITRIFVT